MKICIEKSEKSENSHISHIIFCKIYIVHFCSIIGTTFSVHSPTCHAACIKICTGTFDTFDTFLQKVKNECDFGTACLHFDTFNKMQSYQKDRKCQKCLKCHVIFFITTDFFFSPFFFSFLYSIIYVVYNTEHFNL